MFMIITIYTDKLCLQSRIFAILKSYQSCNLLWIYTCPYFQIVDYCFFLIYSYRKCDPRLQNWKHKSSVLAVSVAVNEWRKDVLRLGAYIYICVTILRRRNETAWRSPCSDNENDFLIGHSLHLTKLWSNKYNCVNYLQCSPQSLFY